MPVNRLRLRDFKNAISGLGRKFMFTESEWNPKVFVGRTVVAVLPERVLHGVKKRYYAILVAHLREDWQETDASLLRYLVRSGDAVVDVGASIGGFTKLLSELVGESGHVYSFEPNPPTYDFLSHNVKHLKLRNVRLFRIALSDKQGTMTMVTPRYRWGSECHYDATLEAERAASNCRRTEILANTMDSIFAEREEPIKFIKCDVNYHELAFLRGAQHTICRFRPALLLEILPNPDNPHSPAAQIFELLEGIGYIGYWFDGREIRKRQRGERSQNYFFFTAEHVVQLPAGLLQQRADV